MSLGLVSWEAAPCIYVVSEAVLPRSSLDHRPTTNLLNASIFPIFDPPHVFKKKKKNTKRADSNHLLSAALPLSLGIQDFIQYTPTPPTPAIHNQTRKPGLPHLHHHSSSKSNNASPNSHPPPPPHHHLPHLRPNNPRPQPPRHRQTRHLQTPRRRWF